LDTIHECQPIEPRSLILAHLSVKIVEDQLPISDVNYRVGAP